MWRSSSRLGYGVGAALAAVLTAGCSHSAHTFLAANPAPTRVVAVATTPASPYGVVSMPTPPTPTALVVTSLKPAPVAEVKPAEPPAEPPAWQTIAEPIHSKRGDRRTFTDVTADPAFAHAADHHWLVGSLERVRGTDSWQLRYASVDEEDPYGGTVTLTGDGSTVEYREGQMVRVMGRVMDADGPDGQASYHVEALEPLTVAQPLTPP
jgi:hypothetical protein